MLFPDDPNDTGAPLRPRHEDEVLIKRFDRNLLESNFPNDWSVNFTKYALVIYWLIEYLVIRGWENGSNWHK
jgi:hypothetical protein